MAKVDVPGVEQLIELRTAAVLHARQQLAAAHLLVSGEHWAVAYSTAALALEEVGKAQLYATALAMPTQVRAQFAATFARLRSDHAGKAGLALFVHRMFMAGEAADSVPAFIERIERDARSTNAQKFRSLYVDLDGQGTVVRPDQVTETEARDIVSLLASVLDRLPLHDLQGVDLKQIAEIVDQWHRGLDVGALEAAYDADPERFFAEAGAALRGEGPLPAAWFGGLSELLEPMQGSLDTSDR